MPPKHKHLWRESAWLPLNVMLLRNDFDVKDGSLQIAQKSQPTTEAVVVVRETSKRSIDRACRDHDGHHQNAFAIVVGEMLSSTPFRAISSIQSQSSKLALRRGFHGSAVLLKKKKSKGRNLDPPRPPLLHPETTARTTMRSFDRDLLLDKLVKKNLRKMKVETMTQIQSEVYQHLDAGKDVVAASPVGSGKTLAYLVPWVNRKLMDYRDLKKGIHMVVLTPTSHSAKMIYNEIDQFIALMGPNITTQVVFDSYSFPRQVERLSKKIPRILIATPSRLRKHIEESVLTKLANSKTGRKKRKLFSAWLNNLTATLVLDEFDVLMEVHREDVDFVRRYMANEHQTIAMSSHSLDIDRTLVKPDAVHIDCRLGPSTGPNPLLEEATQELLSVKAGGSVDLRPLLQDKNSQLELPRAARSNQGVRTELPAGEAEESEDIADEHQDEELSAGHHQRQAKPPPSFSF